MAYKNNHFLITIKKLTFTQILLNYLFIITNHFVELSFYYNKNQDNFLVRTNLTV